VQGFGSRSIILKNCDYYGVLLLQLANQGGWTDGACRTHGRDVRSLYLLYCLSRVWLRSYSCYPLTCNCFKTLLLLRASKGGALAGLGKDRQLCRPY
jgi:hypothetical protein